MDNAVPQIKVTHGERVAGPEPLSDFDIQEIHAGLLIPNAKAIHSMAREIRKWRGVPDPDGA